MKSINQSAVCQICDSKACREFEAREMMFGLRDVFRYFECSRCGCLQLIEPPHDMSKYYPRDQYYSLQSADNSNSSAYSIRSSVKRVRDSAILFRKSGWFASLAKWKPNPGIADLRRWIAPTNIRSFRDQILDIGCGSGQLLYRMEALGFENLTGFDPYLKRESDNQRVKLISSSLRELSSQQFDLVMLHHALEHLPDQQQVFTEIRRLLSPQGVCLIRIPIASRGPWNKFGCNWVELDAPRHFFLHTELSIKILAESCGMHLFHVQYEDAPFAYLASELYERDQSLYAGNDSRRTNFETVLSKEEIEELTRLSRINNVPGWASRAAFFLSVDNQKTLSASFFNE